MPKRKNSRAAAGSGSIRQRPDGRWEGRYSAGVHPGTGKQIQKSVYGDTQREVLDKLTEIKAGLDNGTFVEPSKLTVAMWLDIWLAEHLGGVKPRTADSYNATCRVHIKPELGAVKLSALSAHAVQTLYNKCQRDKGLSAKSIKNLNGVLHKAMQQAVELGYIRFNPCNACKLPRIERKEITPLNDEQIATFLNAIKGHKWDVLFLVTLFTGMRQSEILGLQWKCVDFERGSILIDKQLQRDRATGKYILIAPKNNKSRRITPAPSVIEALREQLRRQSEWRLKAGQAWENTGLVFTNELGHNLSAQTVYLHYKKIVISLDIPEAGFHDLRHSYAVAALQSGDDVKTVQENLGHHTASFTLDVYGHVTEKMKQESAARMEVFINAVKKGS